VMLTPAHQIAQLEYVVREQMKEIDRLRAEVSNLVGWIMGDRDVRGNIPQLTHCGKSASD
jgi:hypothetical protein